MVLTGVVLAGVVVVRAVVVGAVVGGAVGLADGGVVGVGAEPLEPWGVTTNTVTVMAGSASYRAGLAAKLLEPTAAGGSYGAAGSFR